MTDLGKLQRVDPRTVWKHEAQDFTPWLAEHIDQLGEVLGLDLEVLEQEAGVGDFSADIIAKDLGRDRIVVIENQLEATDHKHLGQLITYAAGREAGLVVWVAREFRDEHRQALDWMNRGSPDGTEYFGVLLELLQVDSSKPAPNFRLVAAPNEWRRSSSRTASRGGITEKGAAYQEFFQALIDDLREKHDFTNARAARPQNWYSFRSGVNGFTYGASFANNGRLRTEVYIDIGDADANERALAKLKASRAEIEKEYAETLFWEDLEGRRACRIACYGTGTIEDSAEELEKVRAWVVDHLLRFKRVFGPRLQAAASAASTATPGTPPTNGG